MRRSNHRGFGSATPRLRVSIAARLLAASRSSCRARTSAASSRGRQLIKRRERCGRAVNGPASDRRAHALKWLPPHRSHATTTLPFRNPAVHRPFGLFAVAFDLLAQAEVAHPGHTYRLKEWAKAVCAPRGAETHLADGARGTPAGRAFGRSPGSKVLLIHEKVKARHHQWFCGRRGRLRHQLARRELHEVRVATVAHARCVSSAPCMRREGQVASQTPSTAQLARVALPVALSALQKLRMCRDCPIPYAPPLEPTPVLPLR